MYEKKIGNSSAEAIGRIPQTKNDIFPDRNLVDREVGVVAAMKMKTSVTNQWVAKQLSLVNVLKISCMANVSIKESDPEFIEKLNATTNHKPRPLFSLMDAENRLIVMETHPAVAEKRRLEFAYDSQGRRIRKEVQEWEPGSGQFVPAKSLRFFYDGWNLIEERDLLNGDAVKRRHVWGLDVTGTPQGAGGVGGLLWSETATHTFAASADANSNIIAWVETATLSVSGRADYGAFGEPVMRTGAAREMPFGFSTKYTDFETDLLYYGYRYYRPSMGRVLNRGPIEGEGGLNLYGGVGNDPLNHIDLLGLCSVEFDIRFLTGREVRQEQMDGRVIIDYRASGCVCCDEVRLIQIVRGESIRFGAGNYDDWRIDGKSDDEWPEGDIGKVLNPFPYYPYQSGGYVRDGSVVGQMTDDPIMPGLGGVKQYYETCLVCIKGQDEGKVIGCRTWEWRTGHFGTRRGKGDGVNLPGQEPSQEFNDLLAPHIRSIGGSH